MQTTNIALRHEELGRHPIYAHLNTLKNIQIFMKYHVFAVWDFMSLLKSLQRKVTCVELPWVESDYDTELVRLVNEIVLAEESDIDKKGMATSHYSLYLKGMKELGAETNLIERFTKDLNFDLLPNELREVIRYHLDLALNGEVHLVAASFFYGREKLIPDIFRPIVNILEKSGHGDSHFQYYLERHIELDGDEHGPKALKCLELLGETQKKQDEIFKTAEESLMMREKLWDFILKEIREA